MEKKILITKLCYIDKEFEKYKENSNEKGYIFIITNSIYSVYNEKIIILDYGKNKKSIEEKYKNKYIEKIEIKKRVKSNELLYKLLLIIFNEYRIIWNKNFFINKSEIESELKIIELNMKKKDGIELYINHTINLIIKKYGNIQNLKNKLKIKSIIPIKCINSIEDINIIKIKKIKGTLELVENYSSPIRKYGFVVLIESNQIEKYYGEKISYLLVSKEYKELVETIYIYKPNIISLRVYDYEFCELMVKDKLKEVNILNGYYMCEKEKIKIIYEKIKYYFENYSELELLKKAYLFNEYNKGKKIEEDKKEKRYDINESIKERHKKILEKKEEFDEEKYYLMMSKDIKKEEPIIRKSRYELVCGRLNKYLK